MHPWIFDKLGWGELLRRREGETLFRPRTMADVDRRRGPYAINDGGDYVVITRADEEKKYDDGYR